MRVKISYLKRTLPLEKFEQVMRFTYTNVMLPNSLNDDDHDSENALHEEGLN